MLTTTLCSLHPLFIKNHSEVISRLLWLSMETTFLMTLTNRKISWLDSQMMSLWCKVNASLSGYVYCLWIMLAPWVEKIMQRLSRHGRCFFFFVPFVSKLDSMLRTKLRWACYSRAFAWSITVWRLFLMYSTTWQVRLELQWLYMTLVARFWTRGVRSRETPMAGVRNVFGVRHERSCSSI